MPPCGCFGGLLESTPIPPTRAGANILIDAYNYPDLRPKGRNESGRYGRNHSHRHEPLRHLRPHAPDAHHRHRY